MLALQQTSIKFSGNERNFFLTNFIPLFHFEHPFHHQLYTSIINTRQLSSCLRYAHVNTGIGGKTSNIIEVPAVRQVRVYVNDGAGGRGGALVTGIRTWPVVASRVPRKEYLVARERERVHT